MNNTTILGKYIAKYINNNSNDKTTSQSAPKLDNDSCGICALPMDAIEKTTIKCNHNFHYNCIKEWYLKISIGQLANIKKQECPYCRGNGGFLTLKDGELPLKDVHKEYISITKPKYGYSSYNYTTCSATVEHGAKEPCTAYGFYNGLCRYHMKTHIKLKKQKAAIEALKVKMEAKKAAKAAKMEAAKQLAITKAAVKEAAKAAKAVNIQKCKACTKAGTPCKNNAKVDGYCGRHMSLAEVTTTSTDAIATTEVTTNITTNITTETSTNITTATI